MAYNNIPCGPVKTDRQIRAEQRSSEARARAWNNQSEAKKMWDVAVDELASFVAKVLG